MQRTAGLTGSEEQAERIEALLAGHSATESVPPADMIGPESDEAAPSSMCYDWSAI
jgi:hypothetical protein